MKQAYLAIDRLNGREPGLEHVSLHFRGVPLADDFLLHTAIHLDNLGAAVLCHHTLDLLPATFTLSGLIRYI